MNYAAIKKFDIANGPGVRVSLFVSGCRHRCRGCFNSEAWDFDFGQPYTKKVLNEIILSITPDYISGLSLLGGEPFEKENQLDVLETVRRTKECFGQKSIWIYTGFTFEELLSEKFTDGCVIREILKFTDVLVDGRFVEELKSPDLLFRGSSNQRIIDVQKSLSNGKVIWLDGEWQRKMGSGNIYE